LKDDVTKEVTDNRPMDDPSKLIESVQETIAEAALHAFVAQRCQRAYVHELRNGLQGIYASTDVLIRMAEGKAPANMATDKVKEVARKSLQSHEQGINVAIRQLTLQDDEPTAIGISTALRELCAFLGNDAAAHDVIVNMTAEESLRVRARPSKLRLALLATMVRAIDSMRGGGELNVTARVQAGQIDIDFVLLSNDAALADDEEWVFAALDHDWTRSALAGLVKKEGGAIESPLQEAPREARSYSNRRVVRLSFPTA
jgi:hypothetical protein